MNDKHEMVMIMRNLNNDEFENNWHNKIILFEQENNWLEWQNKGFAKEKDLCQNI